METEGMKNYWDPPLYLQCDCHQPHHAIIWEPDPDIDGSVSVAVISSKSGRFWHRVKYAMRHIFSGEHLIEGDLILNRASVHRLRDFCQTVMDRADAGKA